MFVVPRTLAAAALVASLCIPAVADADVDTGDRAAELVAAKDGRGRRVKLKAFRNKVVVLTFGASWCKPCKAELPAWDKLAGSYKAKGVVFVAINIDKDKAKGKKFMRELGIKRLRAAFEPEGATVESYDPPTMPTTYVIDKRGIVRYRHAGYHGGDAKKLAKHIDKLL